MRQAWRDAYQGEMLKEVVDGVVWYTNSHPVWFEDIEDGDVWMDSTCKWYVADWTLSAAPNSGGEVSMKVRSQLSSPGTQWITRQHDELCGLLGHIPGDPTPGFNFNTEVAR